MQFSIRTLFAISLTTVSIGCGAAPSVSRAPFIGEWKLRPSRSRYIDVMKVESGSGDKYTFDFGAGGEVIAVDGTDQPGRGGTTLSITVEGRDDWRVVRKKDGRLVITAMWKLSQDGNTLTDDYEELGLDGQVSVHATYQYQRTESGQGFAGTWESPIALPDSRSITLQIRPYGADGLALIVPSADVTQNVRFDGGDYPVVGHGAAEGSTTSARQVDKHTLEVTNKTGGKIKKIEHIELSPDLRTLTKTARPVGQREPNILVFERQ